MTSSSRPAGGRVRDALETHPPADHAVYVAIIYTQMNRLRARLAGAAKETGYALASYVSSRAFVWRNVRSASTASSSRTTRCSHSSRSATTSCCGAATTSATIRRIRDNCFISSHVVVSGSCEIGENSFLGVNATLVNDITIGADSWIGPHVVLTRDVEPAPIYRPARSDLREQSSFEVFGVEPDG